MNKIRDYKQRGLKFVVGDKRTSNSKDQGDVVIGDKIVDGHNIHESHMPDYVLDQEVLEFAWRINEGKHPAYNGEIEFRLASSEYHKCKCSDVSFDLSYGIESRIYQWRPVIETPPVYSQLDPRYYINEELVVVAKGDAYDSSLTFIIKLVGKNAACIEDRPGDLDIIKLDEHDFYLTPEANQAFEVSQFLKSKGFAPTEDLYEVAIALQKAGLLKEL